MEAAYPVADRLDHARSLDAEDSRPARERVKAGALIDVDEVDPHGRLPDQQLTQTRPGHIARHGSQLLRAPRSL